MQRSSLVGVLLVAGAICSVAPAWADTESDALITRGIELREKGRDEEALGLFRQALAKSPSARARAQVALAEQALGLWVLAESDLVAALATDGDPWIAKNRTALEGALAVIRKHIASLEVRGAEQAEVYVDGVRIGSGAGPFRVEAGRRSIEVRAPGFHPTTRLVELPPGSVARETVTLVPAPATTAPAARETPATPPPPPPRETGGGQRVLGWAFVGTGAALLATGGIGLVVRKGIIDDYNVSCPGLGVAQPASCDDQIGSSRTWFTIAMVSLIGGGVLAAGGGVLIATAPSGQAKTAARVTCAPSLGALSCVGTF